MWSRLRLSTLAVVSLLFATVSAHFEIVYPAWRGNTLHDDWQWSYPCGRESVTTNRTKWPITGGPISVIPGWNAGHPTSFFYINMGYGNDPVFGNQTNVMHSVFQTTGPSKEPYPGFWCLPQVPLPANATVKVGDNATIQIIQVALHGGDLYNCADITLVDEEDMDPVPEGTCVNSSDIGFNLVYTTNSEGSRRRALVGAGVIGVVSAVVAVSNWLF